MIEGLLGLVAIAAVLGIAYKSGMQANQAWQQAADGLGVSRPAPFRFQLLGDVDGVAIEVRSHRGRRGGTDGLRVTATGALAPDMRLQAEAGMRAMWRSATGRGDVVLGDPTLDGLALIDGHPPFVLASLGAEARAGLTEAMGRHTHVSIEDGALTLFDVKRPRTAGEIMERVHEAIGLVKTLSLNFASIPQRLADHARDDPQPGVRRRNLEVLADYDAGSAVADAALRTGLTDPDAGVRLVAATHLGSEGSATMVELAGDRRVADRLRLEAVEHVDRHATVDALAVMQTLTTNHDAVSLAMAVVLARHGTAPLARWLDGLAEVDSEPAQVAFADIVGALGLREREPGLLRLLSSDSDRVKVAAAQALAAAGSIGAVEALLDHGSGLLIGEELKSAARLAVATIQARAGHGERGALTVSTGPEAAGSLALTEAQEGHLAVTEEA